MKEETKFPQRLRLAMEQRKMTQAELCKKTGINKSTLSLYASGKRHATDYNMFEIAKALHVEITWLMGYTDENSDFGPTPYRDELTRMIQTMDEDSCKKAIKFINDFINN